ncbi:MAG: Spy/CpxP family protein refolding chaperone [Thermoanaerobaculia bacterium]
MRIAIGSALAGACLAAGLAMAQSGLPYAGHESREIKALAPEEVAAYEAGEGMGYAKAAELNHYPGPRHVLDLEKELRLTAAQAGATREIYRRMHESAVRLGQAILEKERELDRLFAEARITSQALSRLTAEAAGLEGELRAAHLQAHLQMRSLLTPAQIAAYDALRGYGKGAHAGHHGGGAAPP